MFCMKCGSQIEDGSKFCLKCGAPVSGQSSASSSASDSTSENAVVTSPAIVNSTQNASQDPNNSSGEKKNWKEYFTKENIEKYGPVAAIIPIPMAIIKAVLGLILSNTIGRIPGAGVVIYTIIMVLLKVVFTILPLAATAGLVYIIIKENKMSKVIAWIAPVATLLAFVSCLGISFRWTIAALITGILSVVLGIELIARIVLGNKAIDSPIDLKQDIDVYSKNIKVYKEKYKAAKAEEEQKAQAAMNDINRSYFDGAGIELLGLTLLTSLVSGVTCGIATPWMLCKIYKWRLSHTVINGKRLTFTGDGASLLGHWILWELLTVVTCGIYGFYARIALRKWETSHTFIEGELAPVNANVSYFDGGAWSYYGYSFLAGLLTTVTCGIGFPWSMVILQKWDTSHEVINNRRLAFEGTGLGFLGEYLLIALFTVITFGIYTPWGTVRMNKYIIKNTHFVGAE